MKSFVEYITDELTTILAEAGGAEAGKLELLSTSLNVARSYAKKMFEKLNRMYYNDSKDNNMHPLDIIKRINQQ